MVIVPCFCICLWSSYLSLVLLDFGCCISLCSTLPNIVGYATFGWVFFSCPFPFCLSIHYYAFWQSILWVFCQVVICLAFADFHHLIPELVFNGYGGSHYMSFGSCYYSSALHHCDLVASPAVVFWSMHNYCSMYPWSPHLLATSLQVIL